ncbi:MAG: hypothetical protein ACI8RZ_005879, partial [Myxococcota bacterium]
MDSYTDTPSRRLLIQQLGALGITMPLAGCGYILYPERQGTTSGQLDAAVIVMDGLLCLLFLVPGVIAFIVDISSGCIYESSSMTDDAPRLRRRLLKSRRIADIEEAIVTISGEHHADLCVLDPAAAPKTLDIEVLEALTDLPADSASLHPASAVVLDV